MLEMRTSVSKRVHMIICLLVVCVVEVPSQQLMPFLGSGNEPPSYHTKIHVSTYLDRLLGVDDQQYEWEAVIFVYLSWRDARTAALIGNMSDAILAGSYTCVTPCSSNQVPATGGCCDNVWTPHIDMVNIKWLPQDRVIRYGLGWNPKDDKVWQWTSMHAILYTPMTFRAFPFDTQNLLLQLEVPDARNGWAGSLMTLVPSVTGKRLYSARTGDETSEWLVKKVQLIPYNYSQCQPFNEYASGFSADSDPKPLRPWFMRKAPSPQQCAAFILSEPDGSVAEDSVFWRDPNDDNLTGLVTVSGLAINVQVGRFHNSWIANAIWPVVATTWMVFLVFFLPRDDLTSRLGAVVALFLALAAIQFVVVGDAPVGTSYSTPMEMLIMGSYCIFVLTACSVLMVHYLTTYHEAAHRLELHAEAAKVYAERWNRRKRSMRNGGQPDCSPPADAKPYDNSVFAEQPSRRHTSAAGGPGSEVPLLTSQSVLAGYASMTSGVQAQPDWRKELGVSKSGCSDNTCGGAFGGGGSGGGSSSAAGVRPAHASVLSLTRSAVNREPPVLAASPPGQHSAAAGSVAAVLSDTGAAPTTRPGTTGPPPVTSQGPTVMTPPSRHPFASHTPPGDEPSLNGHSGGGGGACNVHGPTAVAESIEAAVHSGASGGESFQPIHQVPPAMPDAMRAPDQAELTAASAAAAAAAAAAASSSCSSSRSQAAGHRSEDDTVKQPAQASGERTSRFKTGMLFWLKWEVMREVIRDDEHYCDRVAYLLNFNSALSLFVLYNIFVVLNFAIPAAVHGDLDIYAAFV